MIDTEARYAIPSIAKGVAFYALRHPVEYVEPDPDDYEESLNDAINGSHADIVICGMTFEAADVFKSCDPVAYREALVEYVDFLASESPEDFEQEDESKAVVCMVGDDREWTVGVDDLQELSADDYCPGCGQVGHSCYGETE